VVYLAHVVDWREVYGCCRWDETEMQVGGGQSVVDLPLEHGGLELLQDELLEDELLKDEVERPMECPH
jgi:hypothetical protein